MLSRISGVRYAFLVSTLTIIHLFLACSGNDLAVAQESVRSLQYIESSGSITKGPDYIAQVMILDGCFKRMNMKPRPKEGFPTDEAAGPSSDDFFEIYDAKNGKRAYVYPGKRQFVLVKGIRHCTGPGEYSIDVVKPNPNAAFDESLRRTVSFRDAQELPECIVDGKHAIGFLVKLARVPDTRTTTYWVDPITQLPIRIEDRHQPADPNEDG